MSVSERERVCDECGRQIASVGETLYENAGVKRCEDCWRARALGRQVERPTYPRSTV